MTTKRFTLDDEEKGLCKCILVDGEEIPTCEVCNLLNELYEENQQIKDLIHTMLRQIDVENITSDSAIYSTRIIFNRNEFNLIRELWKRSYEE